MSITFFGMPTLWCFTHYDGPIKYMALSFIGPLDLRATVCRAHLQAQTNSLYMIWMNVKCLEFLLIIQVRYFIFQLPFMIRFSHWISSPHISECALHMAAPCAILKHKPWSKPCASKTITSHSNGLCSVLSTNGFICKYCQKCKTLLTNL